MSILAKARINKPPLYFSSSNYKGGLGLNLNKRGI